MRKGKYFDYVWHKAIAIQKAQVARSYLGTLWWVLEPLFFMSIFYLVFGVLFQRGGEGFAPQLILGISVWLWFVNTVSRCIGSVDGAVGLILQVSIPKYIFPFVSIVAFCQRQILVFALMIGLLIYLDYVSFSWIYFPVLVALQLFFLFGVGCFIASIVPFIPDLKSVIPLILQMGMFCSGVFYTVDTIPEHMRFHFFLNPMATLIAQYREVLIVGAAPDWNWLLYVLVVAFLLFAVAMYIFCRYDKIYARSVV